MLHELNILLRERQNGYTGKINALAAREMKQQIKRPFKSLHINEKRRFAFTTFGFALPQRVHRHERAVLAVCVCARFCQAHFPTDRILPMRLVYQVLTVTLSVQTWR